MNDLKSKLPDLKEITGMAGKLFTDVKKSVVEIAGAYKEKRKDEESAAPEAPKAEAKAKTEAPKAKAAEAEKPKAEEPPEDIA